MCFLRFYAFYILFFLLLRLFLSHTIAVNAEIVSQLYLSNENDEQKKNWSKITNHKMKLKWIRTLKQENFHSFHKFFFFFRLFVLDTVCCLLNIFSHKIYNAKEYRREERERDRKLRAKSKDELLSSSSFIFFIFIYFKIEYLLDTQFSYYFSFFSI